ncbi:hypothetical protein DFJ77DRAFT_427413 [Powellomyces hirtus]|nr:hypothetical protein DFJ77DRAFT_427413 [Powellomyces hirtus]
MHAVRNVAGCHTYEENSVSECPFFQNSLLDTIRREISNPVVLGLLETYPEETTQPSELWHGVKWHEERILQALMVRVNGLDFYNRETAMTGDGTLIRIMKFFKLKGKMSFLGTILTELPALPQTPAGQLFALARHPLSSITRPMEDLLPSASITMVVKQEANGAILNIQAPVNHLRQTANGCQILVVPLVMFCDGSSGNISKQWNNHDTWILTLAGFPFDQRSSGYHQHFVCTSNGLDGMEMTSAIVDQLKQLTEGISCVHGVSHEPLLVIGGLLCLLGDNRESSKFCCHSGLMSLKYCRYCEVSCKLTDATGLIEIVSTPTTQRNWQTTAAIIAQQLQLLFEKRTKTKIRELQTATGVKCVLAQKVIDKVSPLHSYWHLQLAMGVQSGAFPADFIREGLPSLLQRRNPLLQLPGFDGHLDTPVKVLHTVLLGFVKYVGNQTINYGLVTGANRATNKATVIARIDSFDANGTDRRPMWGSTFVTYVGSLIGRDFKAFIQAGVFIFHRLIADDAMAMWEKLAVLSVLVYENRISNLDAYCDQLKAATNAFFAAVANFSIQVFKKTKYHIFCYLVQDVRRFGLPRHYHMETSERFNHAIRRQSVHSNRQAPSLNIASGFSLLATMRHVVLAGILRAQSPVGADSCVQGHNLSCRRPDRTGTLWHPTESVSICPARRNVCSSPRLALSLDCSSN